MATSISTKAAPKSPAQPSESPNPPSVLRFLSSFLHHHRSLTSTCLTEPVDLASVPTPQLTQIKNQMTQELSELTNSFAQLRAAQAKFRDCIVSIRDGVAEKEEGMLGSWLFQARGKVASYRNRHTRSSYRVPCSLLQSPRDNLILW